jgi:hypothetical protein
MKEYAMQRFRPEIDLLLSCARTCPGPAASNRTRELLENEIDWAYLLRTAERHGLIPLLDWNLRATAPERIPSSIMERIRTQFLVNAGRNLILTGKLLKILNLLEANDILAIPFKGPVLASSLYGDLALRSFSDLDILVLKRDMVKSREVIISSGFQWKPQLSPVYMENYKFVYECLTFKDKNGRDWIEIDGWISSRELPWNFELEYFAQRLIQVPLEGKMVPAFSPEDLLLILCLHGAKHCWSRLSWLCDIAELIRVYERLDWGKVLREAETRRCKRMLLLGLFLGHKLLEADLPNEICAQIQGDPRVRLLGDSITQKFLSDETPVGTVGLINFYLRLSDRFKQRSAFLMRMVFTPTVEDMQNLPLPCPLSFLYYFAHPLRLLRKYGLHPVKSFIGV